jgi:hypothetical protein
MTRDGDSKVAVVAAMIGCGQVVVDADFDGSAVVDGGVLSNCLIKRMAMVLGQRTSFYA